MIPDIEFPIAVLLLVYGLFVLCYIVWSLFNVYHLLRFGIYGYTAYVAVAVFAGVSVFLLGASVFFLSGYDWTATFSFSDLLKNVPSEDDVFNL